jgi:hypothetical protein
MTVDGARVNLDRLINLDDSNGRRENCSPEAVFDLLAGGADDGQTLRDNRVAYPRRRLMPRVLRALHRLPICARSCSGQRRQRDGIRAVARRISGLSLAGHTPRVRGRS